MPPATNGSAIATPSPTFCRPLSVLAPEFEVEASAGSNERTAAPRQNATQSPDRASILRPSPADRKSCRIYRRASIPRQARWVEMGKVYKDAAVALEGLLFDGMTIM